MSIGAGVVRAVALQEIDDAPHAQASAQGHNEGLQGSDGGSEKLHKNLHFLRELSPAMKKAAHVRRRVCLWTRRHKLRSTPFPPYGENCVRFVAPPPPQSLSTLRGTLCQKLYKSVRVVQVVIVENVPVLVYARLVRHVRFVYGASIIDITL